MHRNTDTHTTEAQNLLLHVSTLLGCHHRVVRKCVNVLNTSDHFESTTFHIVKTPWWWHPRSAETCRETWRIKDQLDVICYLFHFLCDQHVSDINISIIRSLRLFLLNYHIGLIVLGSMCVGVSVWLGWSGIRVAGFSLHLALSQCKKNRETFVFLFGIWCTE
jgi:hypothetical protein